MKYLVIFALLAAAGSFSYFYSRKLFAIFLLAVNGLFIFNVAYDDLLGFNTSFFNILSWLVIAVLAVMAFYFFITADLDGENEESID